MKRYLLKFLGFFFLASIAWGFLFGLWLGLYMGFIDGLLYGFQGGIVFGFISTIITFINDYFLRKSIFRKFGKECFDLIYTKELFLKKSSAELMEKGISILKSLDKIKEVVPNYENNSVMAIRGLSWRSFGEKIELKFISENEKTKISIQSKPINKWTIFDGGKNMENVELISSFLER